MLKSCRARTLVAAIAVAAACSSSANAHHSAAAFDRTSPYTLTGTVKEFLWANPHVWIKMMVPNETGGSDLYELEGPSVTGLARGGLTSKSIKAGDQIKLLVAPYRDGSNRGEFMVLWLADGTQIKF
jgi:hypothetical protein